LTINPNDNPAKNIDWIKCIGRLNNDEMLEMYSRIDALIFLSKKESYGFPLIEAMYIGIPILCPDLPYARILCGDQAIYFNEDDINSLKDAVYVLNKKLKNGWWPDWREQIKDLPKNWDSVAKQLIDIVYSEELQKIT
jgi:glycosyltransferase involved in cell wall biosynthesis